MAFWHEPRQSKPVAFTASQKIEGLHSCMLYPSSSQTETEFRVYAQLWTGEGEPELWYTQGWVELWPKTPVVANNFQDARRLQLELLERLELAIDKQLYNIASSSKDFVEAIEHPSRKLLARIYRHQDGKFELDYLGWNPGRGGGWGMSPRFGIITFASDLDSAREAAHLEMNEFAAQGKA